MISTLDAAGLVLAGVVAGVVGSAGGITSMVSYPALLVAGLHALPANVANNIALVACWPGSALASRAELAGRARWLARWSVVAALGGGAGAALLVLTPPGVFERIVPFLVLAGSLALLSEPRLTAWRERRARGAGHGASLPALLIPLSIYNGYFGAGAGVMVLTLMLILVDRHLPTANALKNMLIGAAQILAATVFAVAATPRWSAALPLAAGMLVGSNLGPRVTRRVPPRVMRLVIAALGIALAIQLWIDPDF